MRSATYWHYTQNCRMYLSVNSDTDHLEQHYGGDVFQPLAHGNNNHLTITANWFISRSLC